MSHQTNRHPLRELRALRGRIDHDIRRGFHQAMPADRARWFIMPFEHAEDLDAQWRAVGLCEAMGQPELASDPRFATHLARGENQEAIEAIVRDWAAERDAAEIDRVLNAAGVICGPIYTIADIFQDEHFWAREMLLKHVDPEFGEFVGPGIVPKFSETPGAVRWSGTWEEGSHNQDVYGGLLGLSEDELEQLEREGVL